MRAWVLPVVFVTFWGLTACDFFHELESLPEAGEDDSGEGDPDDTGTGETGGETEGEPCTVLDDHCSDQDTLQFCSPNTLAVETLPCGAFCGSEGYLNFTCTPNELVPGFPHGCWCATPGNFKIFSCSELESCIVGCGSDPDSDCTIECFTRTDAQTVRLLGTLYSCADIACDEVCLLSPGECGTCLQAARAGLWGDCGIERQVCNADENDEPSWP